MTSKKSNIRIFEFGSHKLKEHHEITLNVQIHQLIVLRIGRDMATYVLALSQPNLRILVSVHNFMNRACDLLCYVVKI